MSVVSCRVVSYSFFVERVLELLLASLEYLLLFGDAVGYDGVLLVARMQQLDGDALLELRLTQQVSDERLFALRLLFTQNSPKFDESTFSLRQTDVSERTSSASLARNWSTRTLRRRFSRSLRACASSCRRLRIFMM